MKRLVGPMLLLIAVPTPSWTYIGAVPTLGKLITDSGQIVVVEVDKVRREKQVVIFKKVADLKGKDAPGVYKHKLTESFHPRQVRAILDWAEPGQPAVCFVAGRSSLTCIGGFWYECAAGDEGWWVMTTGRPELSYAYRGSVAKLRHHVTGMLAGKEVVITALKDRLFGWAPGPVRWVERKWENWDTIEAVGARRLMRGKDWLVCRIRASLKMPNVIPELYRDTDRVIGDGPAAPEDVPALVEALKRADARIRIEAAEDLGMLGPSARVAVPMLFHLSKNDRDVLVRIAAATALAGIDPKNETAAPLLVEVLNDKVAKVRKKAAECLGDLGPGAKSAVSELVKAVQDPDPTVNWAAIDALGQIGPDAEAAIPALVECLKDANCRGAAVDALGQIGRKARAAIPPLEQTLKSEDLAIRWAAAAALVRIGGAGVNSGVRYLLETASRNKTRNWTDANNILMAPSAREALPAVILAVRDPAVRELASATAVDVSTYLTKDPLSDVKELLTDDDAGVRCVAVWVLYGARAIDLKEVVSILQEALKAADPWVRRKAVGFLGALGANAKDAATALTEALEDNDKGVRDVAARALKAIHK